MRVKLSATRDVNSESIEPRAASKNAEPITVGKRSIDRCGKTRSGKPLGISPMRATASKGLPNEIHANVINATRGAGNTWSRLGHTNSNTSVPIPSIAASHWALDRTFGSVNKARNGLASPPTPTSGANCSKIIMTPIPLINPETTGKGTMTK